jgi:double-strand break repair protein MRE11
MSSSEEENAARKNTRRTRKRRYDEPEDQDDDNHDTKNNKGKKSKVARPRARLAPFESKEQDSMMVDPSMEEVDEEGGGENGSDEDDDTSPRNATFHTAGSTSNTSRTTTTTDENSPIPMSVDEDTIRIMVSTDNHLGYAERDPDRGMDSFAALEEVMYLAKHYQADMVLLGGDLFHENKPSRQTLHTTMDILRRYTMGPNPIHIQIVSSPDATPFRVGQRQVVNYEDEHYSVDLPIFAIHGNHDDPTRDGTNGELLSAMDFLDVCNFVNYFGRQDQVHQVQVAPIMIQKGETNLALYGLGHMRDERLNRMWQSKKVRFLRPQPPAKKSDVGGAAAERTPQEWFNLFVIHQNRDYGRGTKNCVHESMIPEWMDLVVWGHEHECIIEPQESVVGTFRISQPGSSVAISLSPGEAVTKQVAILDVRGSHFRMLPIPLTQVRTMLMGDVSLNTSKDYQRLDPDDPKIDDKLTNLLQEQVQVMIHDAQETTQDALALASRKGNVLATQMLAYRNRHANDTSTNTTSKGDKTKDDDDDDDFPLKNRLQKPNQPLIRLRVEHAGFSPVNNQRFGAKFVGVVANPTEILLFHRKREGLMGGGGKRGGGKDAKRRMPGDKTGTEGGDAVGGAGSIPVELQIEDLVSDELHSADKKLEIMDNDNLNDALEEYVTKQQARAFDEVMENLLNQQQKTLILKKHRQQDDDDGKAAATEEEEDETPVKKKKATAPSKPKGKAAPGKGRTKKKDDDDDDDEEEKEEEDVMYEDDDEEEDEPSSKARGRGGGGGGAKRGGGTKALSARSRKTASLDDDDDEGEEDMSNNRRASPRKLGRKGPAPKYKEDDEESFDDDQEEDVDEVVELDPPPKRGGKTTSKSRPSASSKSRVTYNVDDSDEDQDVDEVDDDEGSMGPPAKRKPAARAPRGGRASTAAKPVTTIRGGRGSNQSLSQSQLSFTPVASQTQSQRGSRNNNAAASSRAKNRGRDDDEDDTMKSRSYELDEGWGTATTDTFRNS